MKKWILITSLLLIASIGSLFATTLLLDDFRGTLGTNLTANGWVAHSGTGTGPMTIADPGLTKTDYLSSGIGHATSASGNSEDVNKAFASKTSGSVYFSFMVNAAPSVTSTDYSIHFCQSSGAAAAGFYGRFFIQKDATTNLRFGLTKASATASAVWTGYTYSTGTTYVIIVKYTFNSTTTTDDAVVMWVNPTLASTEPTPTLTATDMTVTDATALAAVGIRQFATTTLARFDGFRVGTSWADVGSTATGSISVSETSLAAFSTTVGTPSTAKTYDLEGVSTGDITIIAPTHFELKSDETPTWANSIVVTSAFKTISVRYNPVSAGTESGDILNFATPAVQVYQPSVSGTATTAASITALPNSLAAFSTAAGTTSDYKTYNLSGTNLTESIVITAPTGYTVCDTPTGTYLGSISVASTWNGLIYVKFSPPGYGVYAGNVTNVANGITTNVAVTGTGTGTPLNVSVGGSVTETFDYMGVSATAGLPPDWKADKNTTARLVGTYTAAGTATEQRAGNLMSGTATNGIYNYAAGDPAVATDRCVGFLSSSSATKSGNLYAKVTNTGTSSITALGVGYNVEKYRTGTNAAGYSVQMYYSTDGTAWTAAPGFLTSWVADATTDGYATAPGDTKAVDELVAVTIAPAGVIYLAWNYSVTTGTGTASSQGLGIDDITVTGKEIDIVSAPTFGLAPGTYYTAPQSVALSCTTPGASINYTTDGVTIPSATVGTLYNPLTPISVSTTTTIKACGFKTGWEDSAVLSGTYTFPIDCNGIATLRAHAADGVTPYKLTSEAILTLQSSVTTGLPSVTTKNKYIQDATGAIQIYDPNPPKMTTSYLLGDGITGITGTLTTYGSMIEFVPLLDAGTATTHGNVVTPVNVTLAALNDSYQAKLIHVTDVTISPATPTPFAASTNYTISDPSGPGILRIAYADLDYVGTAVPTTAKDYIGVCLRFNTAYQLVPRSLAEITDAFAAPIDVVITVVGNNIQLNWGAVPGATSYNIYYSLIPGGTWTEYTTSGINSKTLVGDALNYPHRFYKIIAVK
jgi:hypothetical protein